MKSILSYLLLCVYATIMIKPVMPSITDAFAHLLNYSDHMATVHKHNGKLHVHYEYIEAAKKDSRENAPFSTTSKKGGSSEEHTMFITADETTASLASSDHPCLLIRHLPFVSCKGNFRPPIPIAV